MSNSVSLDDYSEQKTDKKILRFDKIKNTRIEYFEEIVKPSDLIKLLPTTNEITTLIYKTRNVISKILDGSCKKKIFVVGPCSIHNIEEAKKYGKALKIIADKIQDKILVVMRVYFEKPRTTIGWKGLINDPNLDGTFNVNKGLYLARDLLLYLNSIGLSHIKSVVERDDIYQCSNCYVDRILYHELGTVICPNCGEQDTILVHSDKPSYKEPPKEISCYSYKRINHFNEWLAQFQAKESTDIPQIVYDKILIEIKKERIKNIANLKPNKLREILKKLKLNKYYEHVPHIINRLNGIQAPTMSRDIEEKLRAMFKEIQTPFIKHCPKDRKNFLSYSYVLHKFVQLLGLDEYMVCFPLLKSREKLHQQDMIWKQICSDLDWEFIKSL